MRVGGNASAPDSDDQDDGPVGAGGVLGEDGMGFTNGEVWREEAGDKSGRGVKIAMLTPEEEKARDEDRKSRLKRLKQVFSVNRKGREGAGGERRSVAF